MGEVSLRIEGGIAGNEVMLLRRWLLGERELRGQVTLQVPRPADEEAPEGTMGGTTLDLLSFVVSNSIALGSLVTSVASWRASRPAPAPPVRIEANGVSITINTDDQEVLRKLAEALQSSRLEE